jgi:hypothetical protein
MAGESEGSQNLAEKSNERFRDAIETVRKRADVAAKTLGGLGSTALAAIGFAKIGDVFPFPPDDNAAQVATFFLLLGFSLMAGFVAFFTYRLWQLNQPIVLNPDTNRMTDLTTEERAEVRRIYDEMAALNRVESLPAYLARSHRLRRITPRVSDAVAKRYIARADEIEAEVSAVQARGALVVLRRRAKDVISDRLALLAYGGLVFAIVVFAISADKLEAERTSELTVAKECAATKTAGVEVAKLPSICTTYFSSPTGKTSSVTAAEEADAAVTALAAAHVRCLRAATKAGTGAGECAPLRRALVAAASP